MGNCFISTEYGEYPLVGATMEFAKTLKSKKGGGLDMRFRAAKWLRALATSAMKSRDSK